ncbi:MAG: hypothetical protein NTV62_02255 [Candidatus Gribaldobacteria bacterium]|nr:hypothetical protein [Candidatus Gribaldobacteria bacterium]
MGISDGIKRLADEKIRPNLALSLHSTNNQLRSQLIPVAQNYSLVDLAKSIDYYIRQTRQRVMFEYLMLEGYNDSEEQAMELASFVKQFRKPASFPSTRNFYFVNLIAYNLARLAGVESLQDFRASGVGQINKFKEILQTEGIEVVQRYKFGEDIKGACGQLAGKGAN